MKRTDNYAGNQVRLFLGELKNGTHPSKVKALQNFQNYIKSYKPNISDDNVDFLLTGRMDDVGTSGLISWCGADSEKHGGQLKRICGPLISFLRWLVSFDEDNIYYERFVRLPTEDLVKINFPKHILRQTDGKLNIAIPGQSRSGSVEDAFELLSILLSDHRNIEDEPEPVDIGFLLGNSKLCQDRFEEWLQKSNVEHINQALAALKSSPATMSKEMTMKRPTIWSELTLKCIPLQEGEEIGSAEIDDEPDELLPIKDPLGLSDLDLRVTQDLYSSGRLARTAMRTRRASIAMLAPDGMSVLSRHRAKSQVFSGSYDNDQDDNDEEDEDNDDENDEDPLTAVLLLHTKEKKAVPSILPSDKSFSAPLFLSLVHGTTNFEDLKVGLGRLKECQRQQSSRRENLVRSHFGLFVQCAEGLEWLKLYRKGIYRQTGLPRVRSMKRNSLDENKTPTRPVGVDQGMQKLKAAQETLEVAKVEAKSTLAPILERMKQSRAIRSAEKVLKSMAALLEYPHAMRLALNRGDLKEVVQYYQRVQAIPNTAALKIVKKIRTAADEVVLDLKRQCYASLLSPLQDIHDMLKSMQLLLSLEGSAVYLETLRQAFLKALNTFLRNLNECRIRFLLELTQAHDHGQEYNNLAHNNMLSEADKDNLFVLVKKYANSAPRQKRGSKVRGAGGGGGGGVRRRNSSNSLSSRKHSFSKGSFSSGSGLHYEEEILDEEYEDSVLEEEDNGQGETSSVLNDPLSNPEQGGEYGAEQNAEHSVEDWFHSEVAGSSQVDYCDALCSVVRKAFAEKLVDLTMKWVPSLCRLSFELSLHHIAAESGKGEQIVSLGALGKSSSLSKGNRVSSSPNRLLAYSLNVVADYLQQMTGGLNPSLSTFPASAELGSAYQELEQFVQAICSSLGLKAPSLSPIEQDALMQELNPAHVGEVLLSVGVQSPLSPLLLHPILTDCFALYELIEASLQGSISALTKHVEGLDLKHAHNNDSVLARHTGGSNHTLLSSFVSEMDFNFPVSPLFDPMQTLSVLAKEEEVTIAQRILDKLLENSFALGDAYLIGGPVDVPPSPARGSARMGGAAPLSVEGVAIELEKLVLRGLVQLKGTVKRYDWVSSLVCETLFQKICVSLVEKLRRKMVIIEDVREAVDYGGGDSPALKRGRKKTQTGGRVSLYQNQAPLQSLEEELRAMERTLVSGSNQTEEGGKAAAWGDFIRGVVRLRSHSLPRIIQSTLKLFPKTDALPGSSKAAAIAPKGKGGGSILNRLFAFDSPSPEPAPLRAAPMETSKPSLGLPDRINHSIEEEMKALQNSSPSALSSLLFKSLPNLKDVALLEAEGVEKYIKHRLHSFKAILHTAFALLAQEGGGGGGGMPPHVARLLLCLNEEKNVLKHRFAEMTIEHGGAYGRKGVEGEQSPTSGEVKGGDEEGEWGEWGDVIQTHRPNLTSAKADTQSYSDYVYKTVCLGALELYEEIIKKLSLPTSASAGPSSGPPSSSIPPVVTKQAYEEYEYLKVVLKPILSDSLPYRPAPLSSNELSLLSKEKGAITKEALISMGQAFVLII